MAGELGHHDADLGNLPSGSDMQADSDMAPNQLQTQTEFAKQLIEDAEARGILLNDYPDLTNLLYRLEICNSIPEEIGELVSLILEWVREINGARHDPA
jgi:type III secretion system FlhB-like substrate exporter